jgi:cell division protein FtsQ
VTRRNPHSQNRRGRRGKGLGRKLLKLAALLLAAGLGWTAWERLPPPPPGPLFPMGFVRVEGEIENLDVSKLQEALRPAVNGGYFSLDMGEIEGVVRSFAWVDGIRLSRVWPDTLEIGITEQKAAARWEDQALLNPRGVRFAPGGIEAFAHLPVIYGPPGMEAYLLETLKSLNDRLAPKGVAVAALDMSKRRAWVVKLDNGLELHFGRQDPLKLLERFLELVPKLGDGVFARLKRVDLRYPNGFAVVWKSEAEGGAEIKGENGEEFPLNGTASNLALEKQ